MVNVLTTQMQPLLCAGIQWSTYLSRGPKMCLFREILRYPCALNSSIAVLFADLPLSWVELEEIRTILCHHLLNVLRLLNNIDVPWMASSTSSSVTSTAPVAPVALPHLPDAHFFFWTCNSSSFFSRSLAIISLAEAHSDSFSLCFSFREATEITKESRVRGGSPQLTFQQKTSSSLSIFFEA